MLLLTFAIEALRKIERRFAIARLANRRSQHLSACSREAPIRVCILRYLGLRCEGVLWQESDCMESFQLSLH